MNYIPQRIGLLHNPPTIVIEYLIPKTQKLQIHKIKLLTLTTQSDVVELVKYVKKRHKPWLDGKLSDSDLTTLIYRL